MKFLLVLAAAVRTRRFVLGLGFDRRTFPEREGRGSTRRFLRRGLAGRTSLTILIVSRRAGSLSESDVSVPITRSERAWPSQIRQAMPAPMATTRCDAQGGIPSAVSP